MSTVSNTANTTRNLALCAIFVALLAICSWISIPLAVPFTMQTFAVFLMAGLLGAKRGSASFICWMFMGVIGVPVFAGFKSGPAVIVGPTGGYIVGFLITVILVGLIADKAGRKTVPLAIAMILGLALCYAIGTVWFMYVYAQSTGAIGITAVLSMCVFPFVVPDLAKMALALFLVKRLERFV